MGLNDSYTAIQSQLLLMQPLPTVNHAYPCFSKKNHNTFICLEFFLDWIPLLFSLISIFDRLLCDYYVIKGHKRDSYYRLTGFPPDFKFSKKKGPIVAAITVTNDAQSNVQSSDSGSPIAAVTVNSVTAPVFTIEQYQQILNLLNKALVTDSSVNSAGIDSCCLSVINAIPWY